MTSPAPSSLRTSRAALRIILILAALAQVVWIIGEFGAERRDALERQAAAGTDETMAALRHETESAGRQLAAVKSQAETVLKSRARDRVEEAVSVAQAVYDQVKGKMSEAAIRDLIREALRRSRFFGGRGYYFIDTLDGECVLLPIMSKLEGTSLLENRDDAGRYIMRELIRAVDNSSEAGYVRYSWYIPGSNTAMDDKIAYARKFPPFNWLIGTGDYVSAVTDNLKHDALDRLRTIRLAQGGRLAVLDQSENVIMFMDDPNIEGKAIAELPDGPERIALSAVASAANPSGGVKIDLPDAATGRMLTWAAWAQEETAFDWTIIALAPQPPVSNGSADQASAWRLIGRFLIPGLLLAAAGLGAAFAPSFLQDDDSVQT